MSVLLISGRCLGQHSSWRVQEGPVALTEGKRTSFLASKTCRCFAFSLSYFLSHVNFGNDGSAFLPPKSNSQEHQSIPAGAAIRLQK